MQPAQYDVIVIGGGPAGSSAAIHAAQYGHKTLIIDKSVTAGATGSNSRLFVFPGFPEGINGADLVKRFHKHAETNGAEFRNGEVSEAVVNNSTKKVQTIDGSNFEAKILILATGAMKRNHSIQGERELSGKGVCYSATIDAPSFKHQTVAVFGKTSDAAEESLTIARFAEKIYFIIPGNKLEISEQLQERLRKTPRIEPIFSASLKKINGSSELTSLTILSAGQEKDLHVKGVFLYTQKGQPISTYIREGVKLSDGGCVLVNEELATSSPGVFACGDILCGTLQHPLIASAQGTIAAMGADKFLRQS